LEEKSLIKNLKLKDEVAFKYLVENYKDFVFNTCISIIQNIDDSDDISQEVFIQIYKSIKNFKEKSSLSTWIYKITVSKCFEYLRFKKRKKRYSLLVNLFRDDGTVIDIPQFEHPGMILEKKENSKLLFNAIDKLNEEQKTAYILKNIQGLSYKKISEIMNKSSSSIESLIFRAKKNLKVHLKKHMDNKK
jgi:RNA polymerase sigma-70 factor (ECF subfamily)